MSATLGLMALQGLGAYAKYKAQTAENQRMRDHLKQKARQGNLTGAQENQVVGNVAKQAYHGAKETKSNITGNLIAGGMEGSIAGVRAKADVDKKAGTQVADARANLEFSEAQAKTQGRNEYEQYLDQVHQNKQQATANLIGDAVSIGTGAITGTGDFGVGSELGMGEFQKMTTSLNEGDIKLVNIGGKQQQVVWNGTQFVPIG
tara:strand:+ start:36 stop:647 length:612 start_codon:yes stop_codon:yes gene_type:complete